MKWHWSDGTSESRFKRAPFFGDLPGALGRHTVSRAGNGQAVLRDYWEYPAFLVHDAYTMHPDGFVDRRGFQRRGIVRSEAPLGGLLASNRRRKPGSVDVGSSPQVTQIPNRQAETHGPGN
jgi:hypothetical protein